MMTKNILTRTFGSILALALAASAQAHNVLTPDEVRDGYTQLFNGTDLSNWKTYQATSAPSNWIVQNEDGVKHFEVAAGGQKHLISKQNDFQNFDMKVQWKVPNKGNSGIFIRYMEINEWGGASGPEAQVVDINHTDGQQALHRAGTCYDLFPLQRDNWWKPTGEWNEFRIIAFNNKVAHYGNGKKIIEYDFNSKAFADAYAVSKYRTYPNYKTVHPGAVYIQHHGEIGIKYRDMRIKKLGADENPWTSGSKYLKPDGTMIDDLTFADNMFPKTTFVMAPRDGGSEGLRFRRGSEGLVLLFPDAGEYLVSLSDLRGRAAAVQPVRGKNQWIVPVGHPGQARVLSVLSGGRTLHRGLLPSD